nr:hypothetical protein [Allomuricauda sp.]
MIPKNFEEFLESLEEKSPPSTWSLALQALWWDAKGDWNASHNIAQDLPTAMGSRIHAYLHRKEGDDWNAGYWYRQANEPFPAVTLKEELRLLVQDNL